MDTLDMLISGLEILTIIILIATIILIIKDEFAR